MIEKLNLTNVKANFAELNENASIGILAGNNAVFTQEFASKEAAEAYLEFVHSVKTENQIKVTDNNELHFYGEYYCPHCGLKSADIDWVELGSGTQISGNTSGHFYITEDKVFSGMTLAAESDICIDLRGNDIKRQGGEAYLFSIPADSSLVVFDSIGGGTIKATSYTVRSYGTFKAYNCNIENYIEQAAVNDTTGAILLPGEDSNVELTNCNVLVSNSTYVQGAAIDVRGGTITVTGGTIEGGTVSGNGGAIYLTAGKLTATDCTIKGGSAKHGGAIAAGKTSEVVLNNCAVIGGTVSGQGGALYVPGAKLTVNGGSITGGTATDLGDVIRASGVKSNNVWYYSDVTLNGCNITNGTGNADSDGVQFSNAGVSLTIGDGTHVDTITLSTNGTIFTITGKVDIDNLLRSGTLNQKIDISGMSEESTIGIKIDADSAFTKVEDGLNAADYVNCFTPLESGYQTTAVDGALQLTAVQGASVLSVFAAWIGNLFSL